MTSNSNQPSKAILVPPRGNPSVFSRGEAIEYLVLIALLALVPLRVVLSETHTFELPRLFRSLDVPSTGPGASFAIDAFIVLAASMVIGLRLYGGKGMLWTGGEWGAGLLAAAAIISTISAGQKHLAIIGCVNFAALLLLCFTVRQLLIDRRRIRLTMVVILATGGMIAAKASYQRWIELPATLKYYESHKDELLAAGRGGTEQASDDSERRAGLLYDYEARLKSGSATAYFSHPNVLASTMILVLFAAVAVAATRFRRRPGWTILAPICIAVLAALCLLAAQSKGAAASAGIALLLLILASVINKMFDANPRQFHVSAWTLFILGAVGFFALLQYRPEVLGRSMFYRSMYWRGAWYMLQDYGFTGVGANNFGRHFMRYKPVACPEDVDDPHSWPIKAVIEWGALGGIGIALMFMGITWRFVAALRPRQRVVPVDIVDPGKPAQYSIIFNLGACLLFFMAPWAAEAYDSELFSLSLALAVVPFAFFFIAVAMEDTRETAFSAAPLPGMIAPVLAGLLGFVIHTTIDLGMFIPAPGTIFFVLIAVGLALVEHPSASTAPMPKRARPAFAVVACGVTASSAIVIYLAGPAIIAANQLHAARIAPPANPADMEGSPKMIAYRAAVAAYPLDSTALDEMIEERAAQVRSENEADRLAARIRRLKEIDPANSTAAQSEALVAFRLYLLKHNRDDLQRAVEAQRDFVALAPASPYRWIALADLLSQAYKSTGDPGFADQEADALDRALTLDDRRIYVSPPNRLSESLKARLRSRAAGLRGAQARP